MAELEGTDGHPDRCRAELEGTDGHPDRCRAQLEGTDGHPFHNCYGFSACMLREWLSM